MDVINSYASVTALTNEMMEIRINEENEFARIFRDANAMAAEVRKEIKVHPVVGRQLLHSNQALKAHFLIPSHLKLMNNAHLEDIKAAYQCDIPSPSTVIQESRLWPRHWANGRTSW